METVQELREENAKLVKVAEYMFTRIQDQARELRELRAALRERGIDASDIAESGPMCSCAECGKGIHSGDICLSCQ